MANSFGYSRGLLASYDKLKGDTLKEDKLKGESLKQKEYVDPYYQDIGAAMDEGKRAQYDNIKTAYSDNINKNRGLLSDYTTKADGEIKKFDNDVATKLAKVKATSDQAVSTLYSKSTDQLFEEAKAGFVPVMIGTTKEQSSPNVYYVPREVANKLALGEKIPGVTATYFEAPPGQITNRSQWTTNTGTNKETPGVADPNRQNYLVISPYMAGKNIPDGKYVSEVDTMVAGLSNDVKNEFYNQINNQRSSVNESYQIETDNALKNLQYQYNSEKNILNQAINQNKQQFQSIINEDSKQSETVTKDVQNKFSNHREAVKASLDSLIESGILAKSAKVTKR
jgi:hypothetical protein